MATNGYPSSSDQVRRMIGQTKTLLNDGLRRVLREESLTVSGVKSELQYKVIQRTNHHPSNAAPLAGLGQLAYTPSLSRHRGFVKCGRLLRPQPRRSTTQSTKAALFILSIQQCEHTSLEFVAPVPHTRELLQTILRHAVTLFSPKCAWRLAVSRVAADRSTDRLTFKDSPFYHVIKPLTSVLECKSQSDLVLDGGRS